MLDGDTLQRSQELTEEWDWGVACMREVAEYAKETGDVTICVECVNRFETHFLNIAEDAVKFCKDVGTGNVKVHLDCFHMIREEKRASQEQLKLAEKNTLDMYMSMKMTEEFQEQDLYHLKNSSIRHWMRSDTMDHLLLNPLTQVLKN